MMIIEHEDTLLLEKRPAPGVWGGLWCFPQIDPDADVSAVCVTRYGVHAGPAQILPTVEHGFTHFKLSISPMRIQATRVFPRAGEVEHRWIQASKIRDAAVPAAVRRILDLLAQTPKAAP
jgi:A/G-specific adenine glycosylase